MKGYAAFPHKLFSQLKIAPSCSDPDVLAAHAVRAILQVMKLPTIKVTQLVYSWCPIHTWTANAVFSKTQTKEVGVSRHFAWVTDKRFQGCRPKFTEDLNFRSKSKINYPVFLCPSRIQLALTENCSRPARGW